MTNLSLVSGIYLGVITLHIYWVCYSLLRQAIEDASTAGNFPQDGAEGNPGFTMLKTGILAAIGGLTALAAYLLLNRGSGEILPMPGSSESLAQLAMLVCMVGYYGPGMLVCYMLGARKKT